MKKLVFLSLLLLALFGNNKLQAQNVNIPDANFKAYLVGNAAINTNADTEIQVSEAAAFSGTINCSSMSIADLTGIEDFTALTGLFCSSNQLSSLDVSTNTALTGLFCSSNQLSSLNVTTNTALTTLDCYYNQLSSLNVSTNTALTTLFCSSNQLGSLNVSTNTAITSLRCSDNQLSSLSLSTNTALTELLCQTNQLSSLSLSTNTALIYLYCNDNQLSSLNVSMNTALTTLYCYGNQLSSLDVKNGNNANMVNSNFRAQNNPNLTCIQVDDATYSTTNWLNKDATASYSAICATSINSLPSNNIELTAYPNPTKGNFSIYLEQSNLDAVVTIYNLVGKQVFAGNYTATKQIDLNLDVVAGVYIVQVQTAAGKAVLKVVKE